MEYTLLQTVDISKEFSGVRVLNRMNLEISKGEILGIIGENGAGKSTFVKILSGVYTPSVGQLFFEGRPVEIDNPITAKSIGISMIPQEFNLINDLNVYENIFLGSEHMKSRLFLNKKYMVRKTEEILSELKTDIDPEEKIEKPSVAQKQMVEIAQALAHDSKQIDILHDLMRNLKAKGVTIIYISHKIKEVQTICDRVMILRDGEFVSLNNTNELSLKDMAKGMVGRELNQIFPPKTVPTDESIMQVDNISIDGLLDNITFDLKKGEILGFSGLVGAGRTELAETIYGIRKKKSGRILLNGKECSINSPQDAVKHRIAYLSEDRQGTGVLTSFDVTSNVTLVSLPNYTHFLVNKKKETEKTRDYVGKFNIKAASLKTRLEFLSGGNQQKVSLAKCLDPEPEIFIFDEPTRGIDINAKHEIYLFMHELVKAGVSCILISSELEEIIGMCSRVVVMREGKIAGFLEGEHINEEEIMYHATGLKGAV